MMVSSLTVGKGLTVLKIENMIKTV